MADIPKRRWFQFGFGTMLVVVTAAAVFLAYHANWIRQRRAFLEHAYASWDPDPTLLDPLPRAPGLLWLFGEEGRAAVYVDFGKIGYRTSLTDREQKELRRVGNLFPEAGIVVGGDSVRGGLQFMGIDRLR
jgi:hypothetical protein